MPALVLLIVGSLSIGLYAQQIHGDYIETRSADVYTGQCFANGEVNLVGKKPSSPGTCKTAAGMGSRLDGLTIAAAVRAQATLGDPYGNPYPAQSVLLVDDQATPQQSAALASFAKQMGGELLKNVDQTLAAPMEMIVNHERHGVALLRAGQFATVQTRSLGDKDHVCGNEVTFYPPLTPVAHSMPAVAVTDAYKGPGLGESWDNHGRRSAFVGTFAR